MNDNSQPLPNGTRIQFNNWRGVVVEYALAGRCFLYTVELDTTKKCKFPKGYDKKGFDDLNFAKAGKPEKITLKVFCDEIILVEEERAVLKRRRRKGKVANPFELLDLSRCETGLAEPKLLAAKMEVLRLSPVPSKIYYRRRIVPNQKRVKTIAVGRNQVLLFN